MNEPTWPDFFTDNEKKISTEIYHLCESVPENQRTALLRSIETMLRAQGIMENNGKSLIDEEIARRGSPPAPR